MSQVGQTYRLGIDPKLPERGMFVGMHGFGGLAALLTVRNLTEGNKQP